MDATMNDTLKRIKMLLEIKGWTMYRLEKEAGLPNSTVYHLFKKNYYPTVPTLEKICKAFGITLSEFFAEKEKL